MNNIKICLIICVGFVVFNYYSSCNYYDNYERSIENEKKLNDIGKKMVHMDEKLNHIREYLNHIDENLSAVLKMPREDRSSNINHDHYYVNHSCSHMNINQSIDDDE